MNSLNRVQLIGNLTRDPEIREIGSGKMVLVGMATNRYWTDSSGHKKDEAEYHNIVVWGKLADICQNHLRKGLKVFFEGRIQTRSWEDDAGVKHFRTEIVAKDMMILSPREAKDAQENFEPPFETTQLSPDDIDF